MRVVAGVVEELAVRAHLQLGAGRLEADPRRATDPRAEQALRVDDSSDALGAPDGLEHAQVGVEVARRVEPELVEGAQVTPRVVEDEEELLLVRQGVEDGVEGVVEGALRQSDGTAERELGILLRRKLVLAHVLAHDCVEGDHP